MGRVLVEQMGINKSAINKESMIQGEKRLLYHGDKVSLLYDSDYTFRLNFVTPPSYGVISKKRPTNCLDDNILTKKSRLNLSKWEIHDGTLLIYNSYDLVHKNKVNPYYYY